MEIGRSLGMTIHRLNRLNFDATSQAIERLSSGLRINRAADDAAGLSISESFTSQVRGTHQAIRNVQDGISMLRTAEGAFSTIHDVLQRMRELAVQGANGTYSFADRAAVQIEMEQLKAQIDQTGYFTSFNGLKLLVDQDKTYSPVPMPFTYVGTGTAPGGGAAWTTPNAAEADLIAAAGNTLSGVTLQELTDLKAQLPALIEGARRKAEGMNYNTGIDQTTISTIPEVHFVIDAANPSQFTLANANSITINLYAFYGSGVPASTPDITIEQAFVQAMASLSIQREDIYGSSNNTDFIAFAGLSGQYDNVRQFFSVGAAESYLGYGKPAGFQFDALDADGGRQASAWFYRYLLENHGQEAVEGFGRAIVENDTGSKANIVTALDNYLLGLTGQASRAALATAVNTWIAAQPNPTAFNNNALANTTDKSAQLLTNTLTFQVGANFGETMTADLFGGALGNLDYVGMVTVLDQSTAMRAITTLDTAIAQVSDARSRLGASENRLEYTLNRLSTYAENVAAANSRVRDTDMADTMSALTRGQIQSQASLGALQAYHGFQKDRVSALLSGIA